MNILKYSFVCMAALALCSCENKAPDAELSVSVPRNTYKVGEPVTFSISGDADNIVFYSGEPGHEYSLKDRLYADNDLMVDFVSYTDYTTEVHPNFQVLVSDDFNGIYTPADVEAATWKDVTAEFTLPSKTGQNTPSGRVSLKKFLSDRNDALVYLAFRYFDLDGVGVRNRWVVRSINIDKVTPEGGVATVADIKTAGWRNVAVSGSMNWTLPGTQLLAAGNATTSDKDVWAITAGINLRAAEPATGVTLKNISTRMDSYTHVYEKPGTYQAVFASSSVWHNSENFSTTSVTITVTE